MTYRNFKLPHLHPPGATYSILLCVADAVPKAMLKKVSLEHSTKLAQARRAGGQATSAHIRQIQSTYDELFNEILRKHANQEHPLADPGAAAIMVEKLKKYDGELYDLYSYSVLSNHVHAELDFSVQLPNGLDEGVLPDNYKPLSETVRLIKGGSSFEINRLLGRKKPLWPKRYRDRFIRGENHLMAACRYTLNNPVTAGLVKHHSDHTFTGGMTIDQIADRQSRRIYPNPAAYYAQLEAYDIENPSRNEDFS